MQNLRPSNIKVIFQRPSCGSPIAVASGFIACTAPMVWPINCLCTSRVWVSTCQSDPSTVHVLVGCVCPPVSLTHPLSMYQSGVGVHPSVWPIHCLCTSRVWMSIQSSSGRSHEDNGRRIGVASSAMHSMQRVGRQQRLSLPTNHTSGMHSAYTTIWIWNMNIAGRRFS